MRRLWLLLALASAFLVAAGRAQPGVELARFHHAHLNTTDRARSMQFYQRLGGLPVTLAGRTDAIFTGRGLILASEVDARPRELERTAIRHLGWAGADGPNEYAWWREQGFEVHTPISAVGPNHFYYFWGPDQEIVEIYTGDKNHWFNHLHLWAEDVSATARWYERHLGQRFRGGARLPRPTGDRQVWGHEFRLDGVSFLITYKDHYYVDAERRMPVGRRLEPSQGSPIDHIAFSYQEIEPVYNRLRADGLEIVDPISSRPEFGFRSFFVAGPDGVLVEIVESDPVPDVVWK